MSYSPGTSPRAGVVIVGGGFAALESALALRALTGSEMPVTLVAPNPTFAYRPAATLEAFGETNPLCFDLAAIADDLRLRYRCARLEAVAPKRKWVRLASGACLDYEMLVLATGARARAGVAGAVTFRDQRDVVRFRSLLEDVDAGEVRRLVFAIPVGCCWPVPLYELALLSAARGGERGLLTDVTLVTPEVMPLAVFGPRASQLVGGALADRGVRFVSASAAKSVLRGSALLLEDGSRIPADRVVAAPLLRGQSITGVPADRFGFVPTDALGRVQGVDDVYAIGDMTSFAIKHGGLATQQADRVAHVIAARCGCTDKGLRARAVLRVRLVGGNEPLFLRAELDQLGRVADAVLERSNPDTVAPWNKVSGRYLAPYLETLTPSLSTA